MSSPGDTSVANEEALLTEYKVAHDEVDRLNRQLWTTAQIFIPLSLAGVGILSSLATHTIQTITTISLSAVGSSLILWGWYSIAKRWMAYQHIAQWRMREIEKELNIWRVRYEFYAALKSRGNDLLDGEDNLSENEKIRYKNIPSQMIPQGRPTPIILRNLVLLMILTWVLLIVREAAFISGIL